MTYLDLNSHDQAKDIAAALEKHLGTTIKDWPTGANLSPRQASCYAAGLAEGAVKYEKLLTASIKLLEVNHVEWIQEVLDVFRNAVEELKP